MEREPNVHTVMVSGGAIELGDADTRRKSVDSPFRRSFFDSLPGSEWHDQYLSAIIPMLNRIKNKSLLVR